MKKFIRLSAISSLVFFFSVVAANAQQIVHQYRAEIPFDFNIGRQSHPAGSYVIRVSKMSLSNMALTIEDERKNIVQTMFVRGNGKPTEEAHLVFTREGEQRFLSGVTMRETAVKIGKSEKFEKILKATAERKNEVVLALR